MHCGCDSGACVVQVLNLRTLKPIDRAAIAATVKKTHRMVFTEEGWPQSGIGSETIAIVNEEAFVRLVASSAS